MLGRFVQSLHSLQLWSSVRSVSRSSSNSKASAFKREKSSVSWRRLRRMRKAPPDTRNINGKFIASVATAFRRRQFPSSRYGLTQSVVEKRLMCFCEWMFCGKMRLLLMMSSFNDHVCSISFTQLLRFQLLHVCIFSLAYHILV